MYAYYEIKGCSYSSLITWSLPVQTPGNRGAQPKNIQAYNCNCKFTICCLLCLIFEKCIKQ